MAKYTFGKHLCECWNALSPLPLEIELKDVEKVTIGSITGNDISEGITCTCYIRTINFHFKDGEPVVIELTRDNWLNFFLLLGRLNIIVSQAMTDLIKFINEECTRSDEFVEDDGDDFDYEPDYLLIRDSVVKNLQSDFVISNKVLKIVEEHKTSSNL